MGKKNREDLSSLANLHWYVSSCSHQRCDCPRSQEHPSFQSVSPARLHEIKLADKNSCRLKREGSSSMFKCSQRLCLPSKQKSHFWSSRLTIHLSIQTCSSKFLTHVCILTSAQTLVSGVKGHVRTKVNMRCPSHSQQVGSLFTCHLTLSLGPFLESSRILRETCPGPHLHRGQAKSPWCPRWLSSAWACHLRPSITVISQEIGSKYLLCVQHWTQGSERTQNKQHTWTWLRELTYLNK